MTGCGAGDTRNVSGAVVTASQTLRAAVSQTFSIVNARVATARQAMRGEKDVTLQAFNLNGMNNGKLGLAGGNAMKGVGVWGQVQYTSVENDAAATAFDGFILTGMVGVDKSFMKNRVLAGLSAGYEMGDFDTTFNSGTVETSGFLVSPYVSFVPNDIISVDVTGGVGFGDVETTRKDSVTDDEFSGETEFMRWFGAFRVNADKQRNKMTYGASVGANYMTESRDAYTETATGLPDVDVGETSTRLGQAVIAARVGYDAGKVQPFGNAQFEYDFSKSKAAVVGADQTTPKESDYGLRLGAGLNINLKPGLTATIQATLFCCGTTTPSTAVARDSGLTSKTQTAFERKRAPASAGALLLCAGLLGAGAGGGVLAGCAAPWSDDRARVSETAREAGFRSAVINGGAFDLQTWLYLAPGSGAAPPRDVLAVYIEGDGAPWINRTAPPEDPTPRRAVAFDMALANAGAVPGAPKGANVLYVARPCQFVKGRAAGAVRFQLGRAGGFQRP
ncbi:MAG: autotransporter outer membrane beta-barrel domain-containing protein [Rhodospirillales bacterium]